MQERGALANRCVFVVCACVCVCVCEREKDSERERCFRLVVVGLMASVRFLFCGYPL